MLFRSQTKLGKKRYFINDECLDIKTIFLAFKFEIHKFKVSLNQTKEQNPIFSRICERFSNLLDLRLRITEFECNHAEKLRKKFNGDGLWKIIIKYYRFQTKFLSVQNMQIFRDFEKWIDSEIARDMYYLEHHANSVSIRSLAEKMQIVNDRSSFGLSRQTQLYHQESLKPKTNQPYTEYDEIFKRLDAERDRILVSNPDTTSSSILKIICLKKLDMIKLKRSRIHNSERRILKDTIKRIVLNPTIFDDLLKEKEEEL